jgi:hypothetical protein
MVFSYLHVDVINNLGTTIITISIKTSLIKTHVEFIKQCCFLRLENLFVKAKRDYDWTLELSIATKVTTILAFDPFVKLHFLPKDTICNFSHPMFQPFITTTIVFYGIGMCGEIDNKFELLVADESNPKNIQFLYYIIF